MTENYLEESSNYHYKTIGQAVHARASVEHSIYSYLKDSCRTDLAHDILLKKELHSNKSFQFLNFDVRIQVLYVLVDARLNSSDRKEKLDSLRKANKT